MMTRDAKIGLLVGLAFILIVGILLSEHITTATMPQQAQLAQAGDRVRRGTGAPLAPAPAVADANISADPQPRQTVITRDQIDSPTLPAMTRIELGQPQGGQIKVIRVDAPQDPIASAHEAGTATSPPMLAATTKQPASLDPLQRVAQENGMEIVNANGTPTAPPQGASQAPPVGRSAKVKEYVAQAGDSLSKMASHLLGANTPANQQMIISLNPSLQKDNNRILVGAKYLIPADPWASALGVESSQSTTPAPAAKDPATAKTPATKQPAAKQPAPTIATVNYVVKAGDSLWKIADREVGTANAIAKIKELNADVLGDSETVKVGMTLKLPVKK